MSRKFSLNLKGRGGIAVALFFSAVIAFSAARVMTAEELPEGELTEAIKAQLAKSVAGSAPAAAVDAESGNSGALASHAKTSAVQLHSTKMSTPLLRVASGDRFTVRVEFTLPGETRRTEYWKMSFSFLYGWQYEGRTTASTYVAGFF